jgi:L-lactate dehydrogenase
LTVAWSWHPKVAWSIATIGGVPLNRALPPDLYDPVAIAETCRNSAATIIEGKGATSYGIGAVVSSICSSILFDKDNVRPISHWVPSLGCCLSLPVVLGRRGAARVLPVTLNEEEQAALEKSAKTLKDVIASVQDEFEEAKKLHN